MKSLALIALFVVVPASALAAPACSGWIAGMEEDEGGPTMTVSACALDAPETYIRLTCGSGTVSFRYDLALGSTSSPSSDVEQVTFSFADSTETLPMRYEEMDGMFAVYLSTDAPILDKLRAESSVAIGAGANYPSHRFGLSGSSKALDTLVKSCE